MDRDNSTIISDIAAMLLYGEKAAAKKMICEKYPHRYISVEKRVYTMEQKMEQFIRDGFIDRYTGQKLINPGILKMISRYFPEEFPYHPHWKMGQTHIAYWELTPTIDHIYPIAKGGRDHEENWVTTSMKNNSIKSNYTIDEIHWSLHPEGDIREWDGLTKVLIEIIKEDKTLLEDTYIKNWHRVSQNALLKFDLL